MLDILNAAIASRIANTEANPKVLADMHRWLDSHDERYAVVVACNPAGILGYASLNPYYAERASYRGVADVSYYLAPNAQGRGIGTRLMAELEAIARNNGFHKLVVRTFPTNIPSQKLLKKFGYRIVGTYEREAILDGTFRDVMALEKLLS